MYQMQLKLKIVLVVSFLLVACSASQTEWTYTKNCEYCPEMITVPGGQFLMGSDKFQEDEQPVKTINIKTFRISRFEITVAEYRKFIEETGYVEQSKCLAMGENGSWYESEVASWLNPGFAQQENHPVVCVSHLGAKAYIAWLNKQRKNEPPYRLLSESEWEFAARAGTKSTYWWGENEEDFCKYTNGADALAFERFPQWLKAGKCVDGHIYTAPVGYYKRPNLFGVEDMVGNVWEWVEDCYVDNYSNLPTNGAPLAMKQCEKHVFRGGAWGDYGSFYLRTGYRGAWHSASAFSNLGFRVAQDF